MCGTHREKVVQIVHSSFVPRSESLQRPFKIATTLREDSTADFRVFQFTINAFYPDGEVLGNENEVA